MNSMEDNLVYVSQYYSIELIGKFGMVSGKIIMPHIP